MKKIKFFYNPTSGTTSIRQQLDLMIDKYQDYGYTLIPFRLNSKEETKAHFERSLDSYDQILVCGGDGTVNNIINNMIGYGIDCPLGVVPCGTSNDFADYLGLKGNFESICDKLLEASDDYVDIGRVNNDYFINVISGGLITSVAHKVDVKYKNNFGMLAYYLRGIGEIPNFKSFDAKVMFDDKEYNESLILFLVLNSSSAGSFTRLAPKASIKDGLLDVLLIKGNYITDVIPVFLKIIKGTHINDKNVEYFQTQRVKIDTVTKDVDTDVDGEVGPRFPIDIEVVPNKLRLLIPKQH